MIGHEYAAVLCQEVAILLTSIKNRQYTAKVVANVFYLAEQKLGDTVRLRLYLTETCRTRRLRCRSLDVLPVEVVADSLIHIYHMESCMVHD